MYLIKLWNPIHNVFMGVEQKTIDVMGQFRKFPITSIVGGVVYVGRPEQEIVGLEVFTAYVAWCQEQ